MEPKCPSMIGKGHCDYDEYAIMCDLTGRLCEVEYGGKCEEYNIWLKEEQNGANQ